MLGNKHTAADRLSRRPRTESDDIDEANKVNIDNFIDTEINAFQVTPVLVNETDRTESNKDLLENGYSEESWQIACFLTSLKRPEGLSRAEFWSFKRKAF